MSEDTPRNDYVMYLVVRESLGMHPGKTAAQCAHASQLLLEKQITTAQSLPFLHKIKDDKAYEAAMVLVHEYTFWRANSDYKKVVLKADDKEWEKLKSSLKEESIEHVIVVDRGLTEIPAGSETVIGVWPLEKSKAPKLVKRLQILK